VGDGKRRSVEGEGAKEVDMGLGDVGCLCLNGGDPFEPEMAPPFLQGICSLKRFSLPPTADPGGGSRRPWQNELEVWKRSESWGKCPPEHDLVTTGRKYASRRVIM